MTEDKNLTGDAGMRNDMRVPLESHEVTAGRLVVVSYWHTDRHNVEILGTVVRKGEFGMLLDGTRHQLFYECIDGVYGHLDGYEEK